MANDNIQDPEQIKEEPDDEPDDVLFNSYYGARTIELNRPAKHNALNASMIRKIIPRLMEWQRSDMANVILISGAGTFAFCSGGDVRAVAQLNLQGLEGQIQSQKYFGLEYTLDHLIATYTKPYVAYMDGLTMGGGAGLSVHAPFRIATERTAFAMPETDIGFFPDVGGSFFLPRLEGHIGAYLALTSSRLKGVQAFYAGVATHYIDSSSLPNLTSRLGELQFKDYDDMATRLEIIDATLAEFDTGLPPREEMEIAGEVRKAIDRCFGHPNVESIIKALENETTGKLDDDPINEWARKTLETLSRRSPTSLKVALRQTQVGREWTITETFQREYEMAGRFMARPDFTEGVQAKLMRRPPTTPQWDPPTLNQVRDGDIDEIFKPVTGAQRLQLIKTGTTDYREYPYDLGLPREEAIGKSVKEGGKTVEQVVEEFLRRCHDKVGVKEKVEEVLGRCCSPNKAGRLEWSR